MAQIKVALVTEALKRGKADRQKGDLDYIRFREEFRSVERGTIIVKDRVIHGYPHIKRIFTLEMGLKRNIGSDLTLFAEEKIDGFNVRIACIDGKVSAFSRGGFLDLFVTEKARESAPIAKFFDDFPGYVLCGEMIGNTPYTAPTEGGDSELFIFDIYHDDGVYVPCEERYALLKKYKIAGVPVLGRFQSDDYKALRRTILLLNKSRKEGMVLKTADRGNAVKYVTPWSDIEDIEGNSRLLFDMPIGFYHQRVLRSAFFIEDFGLDHDAHAKMLGKAFYEGLCKAIETVKEGNEIAEEFEILIKDQRIWDDIHRHMSKDVKVELVWKRPEKDKTRIRFRKIYKRTSRNLTAYSKGKGIAD
jgi:putative ATP-dependent DNA ligase